MKKNLVTILSIFLIPVIAYMMLTHNDTNVVNANNSHMPEMVKFTSTMCLDCQTMNKILKEVYPQFENKITLTEVEVQDKNSFNNDQIKKYNVTLVPTIILINSDGSQAQRIEGAIPKEKMQNYLEALK